MKKSSVEEIRSRFDADVERFSNLETGQTATVDARLAMDLVAQAAAATTPTARDILDVGCGAGNYALRLLAELPNRNVRLLDLSQPMLDRARDRVLAATQGTVSTLQGDVREVDLGAGSCDIILAAAVLHHLRSDDEWRQVFAQLHAALRPGGSLWIFDLVQSSSPAVERLMWQRYGEYLVALKGAEYREQVFAYIEQEDTPRPLLEQLELLRQAGFSQIDVLHKHGCFAAFGGVKPAANAMPASDSPAEV